MNDSDSSEQKPQVETSSHVATEKEQLFGVIASTVIFLGFSIYIIRETHEIPWWFPLLK